MEKIYNTINHFLETSRDMPSKERINNALKVVLELYNADRAYIFELEQDIMIGCNTYEVCAKGVKSEIQNLQEVSFDTVPRWADIFSSMEAYYLDDIEDIKEYYNDEYELLKSQNIKKMIAIPFKKGKMFGFLGVDNPKIKYGDSIIKMFSEFIIDDIEKVNAFDKKKDCICPYVIDENDIYISLLGNFGIFTKYGTYDCNISNSKQCLLFLIYMLIYRNKYISIEKITKIIWGNADVFEPYQYVKNMVFRARKALKFEDIIVPYNGSYRINPKYNIILDIEKVDLLYNNYITECNEEEKADYCKKILDLYKGDLSEIAGDSPWLFNLSINYKKKYVDILKFYLNYLYKNKKYNYLLSLCSDRIAIESNNPLLHRYIIMSHYHNGDINIANSYLRRSVKVFSKEEFDELMQNINL